MVYDVLSMVRIFAVYDCCRAPLKNYSGLSVGRGVASQDGEFMEEEEDQPTKYFHIQACGPGGIADADGGFAKRIFDCCQKYSQKGAD